VNAEDYDILNDFGETDHVVDLFSEINNAYDGKSSVFDNVGEYDIVLAFFPCTRFESKVPLLFRGQATQQKNYTDEQKLEYSIKLHTELHNLYILICKLFIISLRGGWRMIVENPYTQPHYLTTYFPITPKVIDKDRSKNGDYYRKPTQYWFVNCEPENNVCFEPLEYVKQHTIDKAQWMDGDQNRQVKRSLIHPQYARRMIISNILDVDGKIFHVENLMGGTDDGNMFQLHGEEQGILQQR
jgi:hypothetical protein